MSNNSNQQENTMSNIAQQLAERRMRHQQSRAPPAEAAPLPPTPQVETRHPSVPQLVQQPVQQPAHQPIQQPVSQPETSGVGIDRDHEIALQLQRQFDQEDRQQQQSQELQQPPQNHPYYHPQHNQHQHQYQSQHPVQHQQSVSMHQQSGFPFGSNANVTIRTTGPDGSIRTFTHSSSSSGSGNHNGGAPVPPGDFFSSAMGGANPFQQSFFGAPPDMSGMPPMPQMPQMPGMAPMPPMPGMPSRMSYSSSASSSGAGGASAGAHSHPSAMNFNFFMSSFPSSSGFLSQAIPEGAMPAGAGGADLGALLQGLFGSHRGPPVATQQDIENNTVTETFRPRKTQHQSSSPSSSSSSSSSSSCDEDSTCSICLETLKPGDRIRRLPCLHSNFHQKCIDKWLTTGNDKCPICRVPIHAPEQRNNQ